jgi:hypothetical protein
MFGKLLVLVMMISASPLTAQFVTQVSPGEMLFSDPSVGVSFRYSPSWKFGVHQPFYMQLSISPSPDAPLDEDHLQGIVFTASLPGVASWPKTHFEGVEFGYDEHQVANESACRAMAKPEGSDEKPNDEATFGEIHYWHTTAGNAGLGHSMGEDIYTNFAAQPGGTGGFCLRFDLAESILNVVRDAPLRALSPREQAAIHSSLLGILKTVSIAVPTR